jgi:hypothetical protein
VPNGKSEIMNNTMSQNTNGNLGLLLIIPALSLLTLTGCSGVGGTATNKQASNYPVIGARSYNTETHDFDRPWPFGPESSQQ